MKKAILMLACLTILVVVGCRDEQPKTIIVEKQVEKPKVKEGDVTTFSIDKNGVEFSTKKGDNNTKVDIKN